MHAHDVQSTGARFSAALHTPTRTAPAENGENGARLHQRERGRSHRNSYEERRFAAVMLAKCWG